MNTCTTNSYYISKYISGEQLTFHQKKHHCSKLKHTQNNKSKTIYLKTLFMPETPKIKKFRGQKPIESNIPQKKNCIKPLQACNAQDKPSIKLEKNKNDTTGY
eukprot:TRINITY_DN3648_c0_g1_i1.p2 TRINITY_DN3648_c0_g1~~TRINITY_DN3648_c0_g1_i1.p2  ORF type:complete len:103 (+),score=3.82 TRINITY_DN3648_c0_g1_i1:289-597(+)